LILFVGHTNNFWEWQQGWGKLYFFVRLIGTLLFNSVSVSLYVLYRQSDWGVVNCAACAVQRTCRTPTSFL